MMDRAKYLGGQRQDVSVPVDAPTFADTVDPDLNLKTYVVPPGEGESERLNAITVARNPLLEASRILLRAQADMPGTFESKDAIVLLRRLLMEEVRVFERLCEQANIRRDHMIGASYCLCTALDEAVAQSAWGRRDHRRSNG